MNSKFYKSEADRLLAVNNRKSEFVKTTLVLTLISMVASFIFAPLAALLVAPFTSIVFARTARSIYCNKDISVNGIFSDFSKLLDAVVYTLLLSVLTILGTFLFIIPGIIIGFRLSLGYLIMVDEPNISFSDAMKKSNEMMKGHCWELFKLEFSFIGWYILSVFTFGILLLWVTPRVETATMVFYARIKKERYGEDVADNSVDYNSQPFGGQPYGGQPYNNTQNYGQPAYAPAAEPAPTYAPPVENPAPTYTAPVENPAPTYAPPSYTAPETDINVDDV